MADYDWKDETAESLASATYILAIKDTGVGAEPLQEMFVLATAFEAAGTAATAIAAHEAAANPHPTYLTQAEGDAAYAPISHTHATDWGPIMAAQQNLMRL